MRRVSSQTIIGRDAQLSLFDELLSAAAAGEPQLIVVAGEAGIGKTRLLSEVEARARARGFTALHGECVEFGGEGFAYAPVVAALRDVPADWLEETLAQLDAERRGALATLLPRIRVDQAARRFSIRHGQGRLCELVLHLLEQLAATAPVLMVLEDVHWADRSSRDLLAFLARNLRAQRIAVGVTYRTGELPQGHPLRRLVAELARRPTTNQVALAPLGQRDVARQLEAIAGRPVAARVASELHARSGGNPFFVEELFAAGVDRVPATLAETVAARAARLSAAGRRLLAVVAAAGGRADHVVLADLMSAGVGAALREALDAGLIVSERDGVALRHGLIGEVVYESLVPNERRELHRALGESLAAHGAPAAQLAHQWERAGAHDAALAASVAAGLAAEQVYAPAEARAHFERALDLWDGATERPATVDRVELLDRSAQAARYTGDRERAIVLGEAALSALDVTAEPLRAAHLYERLGEYASWDDRAALAHYDQVLRLLPPDATAQRARLLAAQGHALMGLRRWHEARERCEAALAVAETVVEVAAARLTLGLVLTFLGDGAGGEAQVRDALATAEQAGAGEEIARAYVHLGEVLRLRGAHADALTTMITGERVAAELGMRGSFGSFMFVNAADDLLRLGRWDEAARRLAEAERMELGTTAGAMLHTTAGHLDALRGAFSAARAHLARADELAAEGLPGEFVAPLGTAKAALALAQRQPERARRHVEATLAALGDDRDPLYTPALYALGIRAGAHHLLAELDGLLARHAAVPDALAHRATAYAECEPFDAPRWQAAAVLWERLGEPYPEAYVRLRHAEALLAGRRDRPRAAALLTAADATAAAVAATPLRDDVRALARRARIQLGVVEAQPAARDQILTSRETEVLELLAEGLTNKQIAKRLFISEKTVSTHVGHIFFKLDAHSRVGAAARAQALGVLTDT